MLERINLVPCKPLAVRIRAYTPLLLAILVGCISLFIYMRHNYLKNEISRTRKQLSSMQASIDGYNALKSIINSKKAEAERLTELAAQATTKAGRMEKIQFGKKKFSLLIEEITVAQPGSVICKTIRFDGNRCDIKGIAKGYNDLPTFMERLKKATHFTQVTLGEVFRKNKENDDIIFEFNITAELLQEKRI
jgi:Tfp pilus assembly protein PilN